MCSAAAQQPNIITHTPPHLYKVSKMKKYKLLMLLPLQRALKLNTHIKHIQCENICTTFSYIRYFRGLFSIFLKKNERTSIFCTMAFPVRLLLSLVRANVEGEREIVKKSSIPIRALQRSHSLIIFSFFIVFFLTHTQQTYVQMINEVCFTQQTQHGANDKRVKHNKTKSNKKKTIYTRRIYV